MSSSEPSHDIDELEGDDELENLEAETRDNGRTNQDLGNENSISNSQISLFPVRCKSRTTNFLIYSSDSRASTVLEAENENDSIDESLTDVVSTASLHAPATEASTEYQPVNTSELYPISVCDSNSTLDSELVSNSSNGSQSIGNSLRNESRLSQFQASTDRRESLSINYNNELPLYRASSSTSHLPETLDIANLQRRTSAGVLTDLPRVHSGLYLNRNVQSHKVVEGSRHFQDRNEYSSRAPSSRRRSYESTNIAVVSARSNLRTRPSTAIGRGNISATSCRPASSVNNRPRSTGVRRMSSPRINVTKKKWSPVEVIHLPPNGPDCLPGCGYSGLPCYVCSTKDKNPWAEPPAEIHRNRFFGFNFRSRNRTTPLNPNLRRQRRNNSGSLKCKDAVKICCIRIKSRFRLPRSRTNQCILTVVLIYILLCIQFIITGFMAGSARVTS